VEGCVSIDEIDETSTTLIDETSTTLPTPPADFKEEGRT
jgi:hypothetical protein